MYKLSENNPLPKQFKIAEARLRMVAAGNSTCAAISGACGLGKTYGVTKALEALQTPHEIFRGSGVGLIAKAYEYRNGGVLVLDDADNLITGGGVTQANIMKMLLAPNVPGTGMREIVHQTMKAHVFPPRFYTKVGIIWITNTNLGDLSQMPAAKRRHIEPILDRGLDAVQLTDNHVHKLNYILCLATTGGMLKNLRIDRHGGSFALSLDAINDVLAFFIENAWRFKTLSVRQLEKIATARGAQPDLWRDIASSDLLPKPQYADELPEIIPYAPHKPVMVPVVIPAATPVAPVAQPVAKPVRQSTRKASAIAAS